MKINKKIADPNLDPVTDELNKLLADEIVLFIKNKNYYWNIEVENFFEIREFYENQAVQLEKIINLTAHHIRIHRGQTQNRMSDYLRITNLLEHPYSRFSRDQLKYLLASHETIINNLRRLIAIFSHKSTNIGAASFVKKILLEHEKMAWMIRSYLNKLP
ncbi:Dps family protein [Flavobacterium sp. 3-210]